MAGRKPGSHFIFQTPCSVLLIGGCPYQGLPDKPASSLAAHACLLPLWFSRPLIRHGKSTASGVRNPGSNPGAIMKCTLISEYHFRTCNVEGTMLTPAWQGWLRIKRGGKVHREPNIMLGMQKHIIIIISFSSTISETNHRARTTVKWAPPLPPQGPACNQAKQHIQAGRSVHVHTFSIIKPGIITHLHSDPDRRLWHTWSAPSRFCAHLPDEWVQRRKLRLRGAQLLIKVTQ